jgi:hypothetical protein
VEQQLDLQHRLASLGKLAADDREYQDSWKMRTASGIKWRIPVCTTYILSCFEFPGSPDSNPWASTVYQEGCCALAAESKSFLNGSDLSFSVFRTCRLLPPEI